jgi:cytochrome c peroxidase
MAFSICGFVAVGGLKFKSPKHFPKPTYDFRLNPLTKSKIALGRMLFYDPLLSKDNSISCASCHSPYNAFAHTDHNLSHGIDDQIGNRNAPALFNLAWQSSFMWDGAINHLDVQALAPITDHKEMGETLNGIISKLEKKPEYVARFQLAYNAPEITGERILKALSAFQLTLISSTAKYDKVIRGKEEFTKQEELGYTLFKSQCASCHTEPLFSSYAFKNNGLKIDSTLNDYGKYGITQTTEDSLHFKVPSLRNLSYSYPYMHDGRFNSLNEVLNHYRSITSNSGVSFELQSGVELSVNDKSDLIAFLLTLDDKEFVFDQQHQFPKEILNDE